jgi:hypothetical protein
MSFLAAPLTFDALVKQPAPDATSDLGSAAHRAVDSALAMADHFSDGAQRGVSLQFSVSGVDLAVRVEMRADGVHTTFRTESPELRAALAHEWQTVVSTQPGERAQKLADPVFTSASGGSSTATDSGAANQRDRSAPQNQQQASSGTPARSLNRPAANSTSGDSSAPAVSRIIPLSTAVHLHTFA